MSALSLPSARDVHSAFMSPVLPLKGSGQPVLRSADRRTVLPLASPGDSTLTPAVSAHIGAVVSSWAHLSESMLELDRALESPLFSQSPALSRGVSPSNHALSPPAPVPHNTLPSMPRRDRHAPADSALLKTILIPCEPSPKHVSFDDGMQIQAAAAERHAVELPSLLFDQTLKYIRSSARSALSTFDSQAPPATVPLSSAASDTQSSRALRRTEDIRTPPVQHPPSRSVHDRAAVCETMCISDLSISSAAPGRRGPESTSATHAMQLIDPFMCVSSRGLATVLARSCDRRLMSSSWTRWRVFVATISNAKVLKLETRLQELQDSFSSLQAKYSLVCSSEFSKRISTQHLRWSASELSAGASIAAVSHSGSASNPIVTRFERIMYKANLSLRVRTMHRCLHSWFALAMRHRQLRSCYNIVSGRRVRRLLASVIFSWYRGAHMQSKSRLIYSDREDSDGTRQLQSQVARQEKMIESMRETNRKLELDLRRVV
jgi:hypothetical protein